MFKNLFAIAVAVVLSVGAVSAQESDKTLCVGIEQDGKDVVHISYLARPVESGATFGRMVSGEVSEREMTFLNQHKRFGKLARIHNTVDLHVGDIHVAPGEHTAGFNVDGEGNFTFVVWDGEDRQSTPVRMEKHGSTGLSHLALMLTASDKGYALMAMIGDHFATVGLGVDGQAAASDSAKEEAASDSAKEKEAGSDSEKVDEKADEAGSESSDEEAGDEGFEEADAGEEGDEDEWEDADTGESFSGY